MSFVTTSMQAQGHQSARCKIFYIVIFLLQRVVGFLRSEVFIRSRTDAWVVFGGAAALQHTSCSTKFEVCNCAASLQNLPQCRRKALGGGWRSFALGVVCTLIFPRQKQLVGKSCAGQASEKRERLCSFVPALQVAAFSPKQCLQQTHAC